MPEKTINRNGYSQWTLKEIAYLERNYGKVPARKIAEVLKRGISAVRAMALKVGVGRKQAAPWTEQELKMVKTHYDYGAGLQHVQTLLLNRKRDSIRHQATRIGLTGKKPWRPAEIKVLEKYYGKISSNDIAIFFEQKCQRGDKRGEYTKNCPYL